MSLTPAHGPVMNPLLVQRPNTMELSIGPVEELKFSISVSSRAELSSASTLSKALQPLELALRELLVAVVTTF